MESDDKPYLIDANVWIAFFNEEDSQYHKAQKDMQRLIESASEILLTDFILQEVATIFLHQQATDSFDRFFSFINTDPRVDIIGIDTLLVQETQQLITTQQFSPKISFTDWSLILIGLRFNVHFLTYDKQLHNALQRLRP